MVFAVIHCLIGDLLIALSALMLALFIAGNELWPTNGYRRIVALALIFGVAYTTFSEWLNVVVRTSLGLFRMDASCIGIWIEDRSFPTSAVDCGTRNSVCFNECYDSQEQ